MAQSVKIMKAGGTLKKITYKKGDRISDVIQAAGLQLDNEEIRVNNDVVEKVSQLVNPDDIIVLVNKQKNGINDQFDIVGQQETIERQILNQKIRIENKGW